MKKNVYRDVLGHRWRSVLWSCFFGQDGPQLIITAQVHGSWRSCAFPAYAFAASADALADSA